MKPLEIRNAIAEHAKKEGITQSRLAERAGLTQGNISRFFKYEPDSVTPMALKLLDALDLELIVQPKEKRP